MADDQQRVAGSPEITPDEETPLLAIAAPPKRERRATRTIGAIVILLLILSTIFGIFLISVLPRIAQSYVEEAMELEITSVNVLDVNDLGADVQILGGVRLNPDKSHISNSRRRLVNVMLSTLGPVRLSETAIQVGLDNEGSQDIALAYLSPMVLRLAHAQMNSFNITSTVQILNTDVLGRFAAKVLRNEVSAVSLSTSIDTTITRFYSMKKTISQQIVYDLPKGLNRIPPVNVTQLAIQDSAISGISATAVLEVDLQLPISAKIPGIQAQLSIEGCDGIQIPLVVAESLPFEIRSDASTLTIRGAGECRKIPKNALKQCKGSGSISPFDKAMQAYLAGNETTVFVGGHRNGRQSWLQDLLAHVSIPIEVPGSQSEQLARDIELSEVKFNLPSLVGGSGKPRISGKIRGVIDIPSDVTVSVEVDSVHVLADLIYKKKKFATIESPGWAPASSKFPTQQELLVEVFLRDAPVTITNQDVFSSVVSELFGGSVLVDVVGTGDVKVTTSLGDLEAHQLPIEANDIEIGGFGFLGNISPKILELGVLGTEHDSMELVAVAEIENPTQYEAYASYFDALLTYEDRVLGNVTVEDAHVIAGKNKLQVRLRYAPGLFDHAPQNEASGSAMLGRYLSEVPVNATLKAHRNSLPDFPNLSEALAYLPLQFSLLVPRLIPAPPDEDDDDDDDEPGNGDARPGHGTGSQFLVSAKFHLFSSTASFVLRNPLNESITITNLHATAMYHDDLVGTLDYGYPIILSGTQPETETTRIPVSWKLPPSDILRRALGGTLRVNATANATVSVGRMRGIPISLELHEVGAGVGF